METLGFIKRKNGEVFALARHQYAKSDKSGRVRYDRRRIIDLYFGSSLVRSAMNGSVYYAAIEKRRGEIHIAVCRTRAVKDYEPGVFAFTVAWEDADPSDAKCPFSVLRAAPRYYSAEALSWRKRVAKGVQRDPVLPSSVRMQYRNWGWTVSSDSLAARHGISFARYPRMQKWDAAQAFIRELGTDGERREFETANALRKNPCVTP